MCLLAQGSLATVHEADKDDAGETPSRSLALQAGEKPSAYLRRHGVTDADRDLLLDSCLDFTNDKALAQPTRVLAAWLHRQRCRNFRRWAELMSERFFANFWSLLWQDNTVQG